ESIFTNLINNSLNALERSTKKERLLRIKGTVSGLTVTISISDNGPGIDDIPVRDIWLPGITTRPNGTGLGLAIVRDAVADLGGTARVVAHGPDGGAMFEVELPLIGS